MALFQRPIALSPSPEMMMRSGVGGLCIPTESLKAADIIASTTRAPISAVIRVGTESVVSHAALYAGGGLVIEAIGSGVTKRSFEEAMAENALAVAYRNPDLTPKIADAVVAFAAKQVGKKYNPTAAVLSTNKLLCQVVGKQPAAFFCSHLIAEAFKQAGAPLWTLPSQCMTPNDVVSVALQRLHYVGHIKGEASWLPTLAP